MAVELNAHQKNNRIQWVRDLLSGDYAQGRDAFKSIVNGVVQYCCLGVACERVAPDAVEIQMFGDASNNVMMHDSRALNEFGMSTDDQRAAMRWNDAKRLSFARIADLIAYATENRIMFDDVVVSDVPEGYAVGWQ